MRESEVASRIGRSRRRMSHLRERAESEGLAPGSPLYEAVEELGQALEELSVALEELASTNEGLAEAQLAAEQHARRYLEFFRFAPEAYVVTDERGVIRELNAMAEQKLGRPGRNLVGKPLLPRVAESDRDAFLGCLSELRERRGRIEDQLIRFTAGSGFDAILSAVPERCDDGLEIRWMLRDVTQRRRAGRKVRQAEARIRAVLEAAQDGIVHIDATGVIEMLNTAACCIFGYDAEELVGRNLSVLIPSPRRERHDGCLERFRKTGEARIIGRGRELEGVRKDGARIPVHLSVGVVRGLPESYVGVIRDLSAEKALQRQLRAATAATTLVEERERRRLAADLHDEIGQLLTLAAMKLGTLRSAAGDPGLEASLREVAELLARAHRSTESLSFQLSPPVLHDLGLVAAAEWLAEEMQRAYGLDVDLEHQGEPPLDEVARVVVFRGLRELLINVARHAGTGQAGVSLRQEGDELVVSVEDGGTGFDPGGVDFGLVSVRERLEGLGGRLELDSERGRGTRARMRVPSRRSGSRLS